MDNASGSGSFLVAALLEGRNFIGIEKNKEVHLFKNKKIDYIKFSKKRIIDNYKKIQKDKKILAFLSKVGLLKKNV